MTCGDCFTIGLLCGAMMVAAACVVAYAIVHINQPRQPELQAEDSDGMGP
jgi:hypothetical protein